MKLTNVVGERKIWTVEFDGVWPVGNCLVIAAYNAQEARRIAAQTITHTKDFKLKQFNGTGVVVYLSGDY